MRKKQQLPACEKKTIHGTEKAYIFSLYEILKVRGIKFLKKWIKEQNNIIEKTFYR